MISIVIPAHNEEMLLPECLDSLAHQRTHRAFEVIVVNNASTDRTADVARAYLKKMPLRVLNEPRKGRGAARATGFAAATGDLIFSTDADTILPPDWVEVLAKRFDAARTIAVSGPMMIRDCSWFANKIVNIVQPVGMRVFRIFFGYYWLSGFNFGIRKEIYERAGGFNPAYDADEDVTLLHECRTLARLRSSIYSSRHPAAGSAMEYSPEYLNIRAYSSGMPF